jgi:LPS O-antigen subunit length determinant protein (WzzB/FepE family)
MKMKKIQNDEIDLFELFGTLWDGKWLITTFVVISVLLGIAFLLVKKPVYQSNLFYSVVTVPPFYQPDKILNKYQIKYQNNKVFKDFKLKFYSKMVFENWKKNIGKTQLLFEDFSITEVIDGFIVTKNESDQLAIFTLEDGKKSSILIKTNQFSVLKDFFNYSNHVNELLKKDYVLRAKNELKVQSGVLLERFILSANNGANILDISHPTIPQKVSPQSLHVLFLSLIFGGIIGVTFVLISNAIHKRRKYLVKA